MHHGNRLADPDILFGVVCTIIGFCLGAVAFM
jgi:hypothetical protein